MTAGALAAFVLSSFVLGADGALNLKIFNDPKNVVKKKPW